MKTNIKNFIDSEICKKIEALNSTTEVLDSLEEFHESVRLEGVLSSISEGRNYLFLLGENRDVWKIPSQAILEIGPVEGKDPSIPGVKVALSVKTGSVLTMSKKYVVGQDIKNPSPGEESSLDSSRCGKRPNGCKPGKCCKRGWCCASTPNCCLSSCCS